VKLDPYNFPPELPIFDPAEESIYKSTGFIPASVRRFALFWIFPLFGAFLFGKGGLGPGAPSWMKTVSLTIFSVLFGLLLIVATEYLVALGMSKVRATHKVTSYRRMLLLLGVGALGALFLRYSAIFLGGALQSNSVEVQVILGLIFLGLALAFLIPPGYGLLLMWRAHRTPRA
jgi:hypothetical protein